MDNKIRRQKVGGAIGLRATGALAKITMDQWIELFAERLNSAGMTTWLLKKYVDDILVITTNLKIGTRYTDGKFVHNTENEEEDLREGRTASDVTMNVLKEIANGIIPFLEFTAEVSNGKKAPVPCLDSQLWYGDIERQDP